MIKRVILMIVCFLFLGAAANVFAEEPQIEASDAGETALQKHVWNFGVSVSNFEYEEPGLMNEKGNFFGFNGSYTYHGGLMLKEEIRYAFGEVKYTGTGTVNNDDYTWELRSLIGYDIIRFIRITPYTGIAYRYLNDALQAHPGGYERESHYGYVPIGVEFGSAYSDGWYFGATLEYDIFWRGLQESHLSDVDPYFDDLTNRQNKGYGCRFSVKIQYNIFVAEPYIKYWNISNSVMEAVTSDGEIIGYGLEPKNNSTEIGLALSIQL